MIKTSKNTYIQGNYYIRVKRFSRLLEVFLYESDSNFKCYSFTYKLLGTYLGQTEDLINDTIYMYELKKNAL